MFSHLSLKDLCCVALLLDEEEEQPRKRRRCGIRKRLKKRKMHGEYSTLLKGLMDDEDMFCQYFKMSQNEFHVLLGKIEKSITKQNTTFREAISPKEKLAVCLRFLTTGDSYRSIAFNYRLGHSTVCCIVIEVCNAIIEHLLPEYIGVPSSEEWLSIADHFWKTWNFPNCIGALDGKHIIITSSPNGGSKNFNFRKTSSVVLLVLVDARYKFIAVDIGAYGKNTSRGIFFNSKLGKFLGNLNVPDKALPNTDTISPHVVLGGEPFPLKPYLLRPYPRAQLEDAKLNFNNRLLRARRVSDSAFGILSQKFRIYHRRIQLQPENVDKVVRTTCILHNYILSTRNVEASTDTTGNNLRNLPSQGGSSTAEAVHVRDVFKEYLNSPSGSVE